MPGNGVYIVVRKTLDWSDAAVVERDIIPAFRPKLELWNATMTMPYHQFRQRLKTIAELNLSRVEGSVRTTLEEVPPGAIVVPVDDDDWFAPELADRLRAASAGGGRVFLWRRDILEPPPRLRTGLGWLKAKLVGAPPDPYECKTNNYAVVNLPELRDVTASHRKACDHVAQHPEDVRRLDETLAVQNRNVASQTALLHRRPTISRDELLAIYGRFRDLYARVTLPAASAWARPYVELMAALMREVRPR